MGMFHYLGKGQQKTGIVPKELFYNGSSGDYIYPHTVGDFYSSNRFGPSGNKDQSKDYNIEYDPGTAKGFYDSRISIVTPPRSGDPVYYKGYYQEVYRLVYNYMTNLWNYNKGDFTSVQLAGGTRVLQDIPLDKNLTEQTIGKAISNTVDGNPIHIYDWNYAINGTNPPLYFGNPRQKTVTERWKNWNGNEILYSKPQRDVIYTDTVLSPLYVYSFNYMPVLKSLKNDVNIQNGYIKTSEYGMGTPLLTYGFIYDSRYSYCIYFSYCHTNAQGHNLVFSFVDMRKYELIHMGDDYGVMYDGNLMRPMFISRGTIRNVMDSRNKTFLGGSAIDRSTEYNSNEKIGSDIIPNKIHSTYPIDPDVDGTIFTSYSPSKYEPGYIGLASEGYSGRQYIEQAWPFGHRPDIYEHSFHATSYNIKIPSSFLDTLIRTKKHWVRDGMDNYINSYDNNETNNSGNGNSDIDLPPIDLTDISVNNSGFGNLGLPLDPNNPIGGGSTTTNTGGSITSDGKIITDNKDGNVFIENAIKNIDTNQAPIINGYPNGVYESEDTTPDALTDIHIYNQLKDSNIKTETRIINTYGLWSNNTGSLYTHKISSNQSEKSKLYYYDVVSVDSNGNEQSEYSVAWGHRQGTAGLPTENDKYPHLPLAVYNQYKMICIGDVANAFYSDYNDTSNAIRFEHAYFINFSRGRLRDKLDPGNWELALSKIAQSSFREQINRILSTSYNNIINKETTYGNLNFSKSGNYIVYSDYDASVQTKLLKLNNGVYSSGIANSNITSITIPSYRFSYDDMYLANFTNDWEIPNIAKKSEDIFNTGSVNVSQLGNTDSACLDFANTFNRFISCNRTSPYLTGFDIISDVATSQSVTMSNDINSQGVYIKFNSDDTHFAVSYNTSPYFSIFKSGSLGYSTSSISIDKIPTGSSIDSIEYSPDGKYMAIGNETTDNLMLFKIDGDSYLSSSVTIQNKPTFQRIRSLKFTDDSRYLYVYHGNSSTYPKLDKFRIVNIDGKLEDTFVYDTTGSVVTESYHETIQSQDSLTIYSNNLAVTYISESKSQIVVYDISRSNDYIYYEDDLYSYSGSALTIETRDKYINEYGIPASIITLIDDSGDRNDYFITHSQNVVNGNEYYNIYSGSISDGVYSTSIYFGQVFPSLGIIVLDGSSMDQMNFQTIQKNPNDIYTYLNLDNAYKLYTSISGAAAPLSGVRDSIHPFKARSVEIETTKYINIHVNQKRFNYSNNPTFYSSTNDGELTYKRMYKNPVVYPTTIGLYDKYGDLLAVGKFNSPIKKTFEKQLNVQVKLKYKNR